MNPRPGATLPLKAPHPITNEMRKVPGELRRGIRGFFGLMGSVSDD